MFSPTRHVKSSQYALSWREQEIDKTPKPKSQSVDSDRETHLSQPGQNGLRNHNPFRFIFRNQAEHRPNKTPYKNIFFISLYQSFKETFKPDSGDGSSTSNHFSADHSAPLRHFTTSKVDGHFVIVVSNQRHSEQQRKHCRLPATAVAAATHGKSIVSKSANVSNGSSVNDTTSTTTASVGKCLHCAPKLCQQSATTTSTESIVRVPALQHR